MISLVPGLPTIQFCSLTVCNKEGRLGRFGHMHVIVIKGKKMGAVIKKNFNVLYYLVQGLEAKTFKRQHQYSSLFRKFKFDQRKLCEIHLPPSVYPTSSDMTKSPRPSLFILHTAGDQKLEAGTTWK